MSDEPAIPSSKIVPENIDLSLTKEILKKQKKQILKQKIQSICKDMDKTSARVDKIIKKYALSD